MYGRPVDLSETTIATQYALGFFKNMANGDIHLKAEVFYKDVQNRIDYIDGANLIANDAIEQVILNGEARAYGLELHLRKNEGNLTVGWPTHSQNPNNEPWENLHCRQW